MGKRQKRSALNELLKWTPIGVWWFAWDEGKTGYSISAHMKREDRKGYQLRVYQVGGRTLLYTPELPDVQSAKAAAEAWRTQNKEHAP